MFTLFRPFALFAAFRVPSFAETDAPDIPATALVTADGMPLVTADGHYLIPQA
jgi:hypothetical protein